MGANPDPVVTGINADSTDEEVDEAIAEWVVKWIEERVPDFFLPDDDSED
jgi:hypothetical protein